MIELEVKKRPFNEDALKDISSELSVRAAENITKLVQESIKDVGAVATGELLKSVSASVLTSGTESLLIAVGSSNEAVEAIENGLPPKTTINIAQLKEWMRAKGLDYTDETAVTNIANKIYEQGFEPKEPFAKAFNSPQFNDIIESVLNNVLNDINWSK